MFGSMFECGQRRGSAPSREQVVRGSPRRVADVQDDDLVTLDSEIDGVRIPSRKQDADAGIAARCAEQRTTRQKIGAAPQMPRKMPRTRSAEPGELLAAT
jgi:hypothetical protein